MLSLIFSTFNHIPPSGRKNGAFVLNFIGIKVFSQTLKLNFVRSLTKAIFVCRYPKRDPIQSEIQKTFVKLAQQNHSIKFSHFWVLRQMLDK